MLRLLAMTPTQISYAVNTVIAVLIAFFFWMLAPTLERMRQRWRERALNAPLMPDTQAAMLKQLRMQQTSLKRLEQFRANPRGIVLYILGLLSAALFMFVATIILYPFTPRIVLMFPAAMSLLFFIIVISECHNLTDERMENSIAKLTKTIEDGKAKLKLLE
jgi:Flp pilus assembly protein TadB